MDKGWGLTLDSEHPIVNNLNFFTANKPKPSSARFRTNRHMAASGAADSAPPVRMFQLPASDNNNDAPSSSDDNRVAVDEVDFFSDDKNRASISDHRQDDRNKTSNTVHVKKENSHDELRHRTALDVNVRTICNLVSHSYRFLVPFSFLLRSIFIKKVSIIKASLFFFKKIFFPIKKLVYNNRLACIFLLLLTLEAINQRLMMGFHLIMRMINEPKMR